MKRDPYILVVDDTPEHIQTAGTILKTHGYHVRVATSGRKALEMVEQEPPAIILLDILMKDMDGFSVCETIRSSPANQNIAIIFVTADHDRFKLQKGFELGGQDYILKPYHSSELIARINTQMKMYHQSRELKKAYAELGQFCHNVSHDLKAPMSFIASLAREIQRELRSGSPDKLEVENMLEHLSERCAGTIQMIEHLLRFAELSEDSMKFEKINLADFISSITEELIALHPERQIQYSLPANLPEISGDRKLLTHLFQNLVNNAIKFTAEQAVARLCFRVQEDDFFYHISLKDNGVGFDLEDTERLFRVFERLPSKYEGTGVGLAMVKSIVTMHGGRVAITGEKNAGATVTVSLPK